MKTLSGAFVLLSCLLISSLAERIILNGKEYEKHDDMVFELNKERMFSEGSKYTVIDGIPTVYYTFDPARAEINATVREALNSIERVTCFKFVQVPNSDERNKWYYFKGDGCWSFVGNVGHKDQRISIGGGCDNVGIVSHETMHALGFPHTQSRPDRDENLRVFMSHMDPDKEGNYYISWGSKTYGTVYDFKSTMHYLSYFFANSNKPTFVTRDPSHIRYVTSGGTMRYNEALAMNYYYNCSSKMGTACETKPTCLNGGFLINDCTCFCPGNFTGPACETFAGAWFSPIAEDRKYTEPGVYLTTGYPFEDPKEENIIWFVLPKCFYPRMKVIAEDQVEEWWDSVTYRMDDTYVNKNIMSIPEGAIVDGNIEEVVIERANRHYKPGRGAEIAVDFIPSGKCSDSYTDFSQLVCNKITDANGWIYQSPKYPEITDKSMACKLIEPIDETKLQSLSMEIEYDLKAGERLEVKHGHQETVNLVGPVKSKVSFPSSYPVYVQYKASDSDPGNFRLATKNFYVPEICGVITDFQKALLVTQPFTKRYPKCLYPNGFTCNMLFRAEAGKKVNISFQFPPTLKVNESMIVYTDYRRREAQSYTITKPSTPITIQSNMMLVTYRFLGSPDYSNWNITVTPV